MNGKVCVACNIELRVKQNGVVLVEMSTVGPVALWRADLYHCPVCGIEAVLGVGAEPEVRAWEFHFRTRLDVHRADAGQRVIEFWANERERDQHEDNAAETQRRVRESFARRNHRNPWEPKRSHQ